MFDQRTREHAILERLLHWRRHIERSVRADGVMTFGDVVDMVLGYKAAIFDNGEGFAIVFPVKHPRATTLHLLIAGGSQAGIEALYDQVAEFGRSLGAVKITTLARPGFVERGIRHGWKTPMVYFEKEL